MSDDSQIWIACSLADRPAAMPGPMHKLRCATCNRQVWIAPATLAIVRSAKYGPRCVVLCNPHWAERVLHARLAEPSELLDFKTDTAQEIELYRATGKTTREILSEIGIKATLLDDKEPD